MEVYLTVRRQKLTTFLVTTDSATVREIKEELSGILGIPPASQQLSKDDVVLEDVKTLSECGFNNQTAKAQSPGLMHLALMEGEEFEKVAISDYSQPPDLPDVMKPQTQSTGTIIQKAD